MVPNNRGRKDADRDKLDQSIAYDKILEDDKISDLVLLYDEKTVLLFGKPKTRTNIKKV